MVSTDTNVTTATMSEAKQRMVAHTPTTRVATQGASVVGRSFCSALLTGDGQMASRPLVHNTRANCRVIARQALKNAMTAPTMRTVVAVWPQRCSTTYVSGVLELRKSLRSGAPNAAP